MLDIKLEELINVLGTPKRSVGHQHYFRCPSCASVGGDSSGDNLLFNSKKGVLKCFACSNGAKEVLNLINKKRGPQDYKKIQKNPIIRDSKNWWELNLDNLIKYQIAVISEMKPYVFDWLKRKHGITKEAIDACGIGFDNKPSMVNLQSSVCFPMYSLNHNLKLVGFELREMGLEKRIRHTPDSPSCICGVYGRINADYLIICEGFKDAYNLYSMLKDKDFLICTPAHGCKDILNNLEDLDLSKFKKCYLLLDNDKAGDEATKEILDKYPFFIDKRSLLKGYKDVSEYWMSKNV